MWAYSSSYAIVVLLVEKIDNVMTKTVTGMFLCFFLEIVCIFSLFSSNILLRIILVALAIKNHIP